MFMSVDLPAPFSPSSAWISSERSSRSIASFASVPVPKRLVMPRISRTGGLSVIRAPFNEAGRPEGRPASSYVRWSGSRDGLELARLHVRGGLLDLVLEARRDRTEIP